MKIRRSVYSAAGALALTLWPVFPESPAIRAQTHTPLRRGMQLGAPVRVVREATERFRDVKVAEAEVASDCRRSIRYTSGRGRKIPPARSQTGTPKFRAPA
jgi:hypothetical protein